MPKSPWANEQRSCRRLAYSNSDSINRLRDVISIRESKRPGAVCARFETSRQSKEKAMNQRIVLGLTLLAGVAIGATAIGGLNAQNKTPGAYAVVDISE